jgi:MFS transporter, DHA3 family, macrolide efflux protein
MKGLRELLRIPDYRRLWFGQVISDFGDGLTLLGLLILTQRLTGSTVALAGVAIASTLPMILFGIPAGALVDRVDRRRIMILADVTRAIVVLGFVLVRSPDLMWLLYLLAFVQASIGTLFTPAKAALIPLIVPERHLLAANTISQMSRVIANLAGTAALGIIAAFSEYLTVAFVIDGLTFATSAFWILRISLRHSKPAAHDETTSFVRDLAVGLSTIVRSRVLLGVLMAGAIAMLGLGAVNVLMVPLVVDVMGAAEIWFGALNAMQVIGMVISGSVIAVLAQRFAPTRMISAGMFGAGIAVTAVAFTNAPWQLGIVLLVIGVLVAPINAGVATLAQILVPDQLRGRVNSAINTVISLSMVVSQAFAGLLAAAVGISAVFIIGGALTVAAGVVSAFLFMGQDVEPAPPPPGMEPLSEMA